MDLPPGFVGNPQTVPKCPGWVTDPSDGGSSAVNCPLSTQISSHGLFQPDHDRKNAAKPLPSPSSVQTMPIYNVEPDKGFPAEFAFQRQANR